jgi:hypothetical protein
MASYRKKIHRDGVEVRVEGSLGKFRSRMHLVGELLKEEKDSYAFQHYLCVSHMNECNSFNSYLMEDPGLVLLEA